jgi:hypothetical protein
VSASRKSGPDKAEDVSAIDSCEFIWESGVGAALSYLLMTQPMTHIVQNFSNCYLPVSVKQCTKNLQVNCHAFFRLKEKDIDLKSCYDYRFGDWTGKQSGSSLHIQ